MTGPGTVTDLLGPSAITDLPGLHINLGKHSHPWAPDRGRWLWPPTADYRCASCGEVESASGDAVPGFVHTIRATHQCAQPQKDTTP